MAIEVTNKPVVPQLEFDTLWMYSLNIMANDPNKPVQIMARLGKVAALDGKYVSAPSTVEKGVCNLHIPDVFALAAQDPAVAQIIGALLTKLKMIAEAEGKL